MQKILLIEDDERVAFLINRGLEDRHYIAELAMDGMIGKKMALSNEYDVISPRCSAVNEMVGKQQRYASRGARHVVWES